MLPFRQQAVSPVLLCLLVGSFALSTACSPFTSESPPLPDSTFSRVLADLHLLSARKNHAASLPPGLRDSLFAHHGVRRKDVQTTLRYYTHHPDDFASLYNAVIDTIKAVGSRRRSRSRVPSNLPDSVRQNVSDSLRRNYSDSLRQILPGEASPESQ